MSRRARVWKHWSTRWLLLCTTLVFFTLWVAAWVEPRTLNIERTGVLAEWFAAVGSTGALVVISVQLLREVKYRRKLESQHHRDMIAGVRVGISGESQTQAGAPVIISELYNGGQVTIHDVYVRGRLGRFASLPSHCQTVDYLQVDEKKKLRFEFHPDSPAEPSRLPKLEVLFKDPAGRAWLKDDLGSLELLSPEDWERERERGSQHA